MEKNQENVLIAACVFVIAAISLAAALHYTRPMMIPFVLALFLSYFVTPVIDFFHDKIRLPRSLAVLLSLGFFAAMMLVLFFVLKGSVIRILDGFALYEARLYGMLDSAAAFADRFHLKFDQRLLVDTVKQLPIFTVMQSAASSFLTFTMNFFLVLIFVIFLVSGTRREKNREGLLGEIDTRIRRYIVTKVVTSLVAGVLVGVILAVLGMDLALMFGVLAFFLNFIPTLGSIVATLLPLPIAMIEFESTWQIVAVVAMPGVVQLALGNVLEPKMIGKSLDLHPVTVLLSLMFWGLIWGVAGMFLAAPIMAVLKIALERIPLTHTFSEMLAGRLYRRSKTS